MAEVEEPVADDVPVATIVVGYDGTDPAEHALRRAVVMARAFEGSLL
jgi:hypothetical protein